MPAEAVVLQRPMPAGMYLTIVDPATGDAVPELNPPEFQAIASATGGHSGILYASIERSENMTEMLAMDITSGETEVIGNVEARAKVRAVAPDGQSLFLAAFRDGRDVASRLPVSDDPDVPTKSWRPIDLPSVSIPERWQPDRSPGPTVAREMDGDGIVSPDGRRWYHLSGLGMRGLLYRAGFADGSAPSVSSLRIPSSNNHYALIGAPDERTLFAVDYSSAMTIHVIDGMELSVLETVPIVEQRWNEGRTL